MSPIPRSKIITRLEAKAILESVKPTGITALQKRTMLETLYRAGLRTVELVNLRTDQIEWACEDNDDTCTLHLTRTKGNRPRSVPVPDVLRRWLMDWQTVSRDWKAMKGVETPYFFHPIKRVGPAPYSERTIRDMLVPICDAVSGRHVTLHMLRHSYATNAVEDGISLPGVQSLLGHRRVETTMVYVDVRQKQLAAAVKGLV
jgi:site-specific recombinase XerD